MKSVPAIMDLFHDGVKSGGQQAARHHCAVNGDRTHTETSCQAVSPFPWWGFTGVGSLPAWTHRTFPPPRWGRVWEAVNAAHLPPILSFPRTGGKGPLPPLVSPVGKVLHDCPCIRCGIGADLHICPEGFIPRWC